MTHRKLHFPIKDSHQQPADPAMSDPRARTAWRLDMECEDKKKIDTLDKILRELVLRFYLATIDRLGKDVNPFLRVIFQTECDTLIWGFLKFNGTLWWHTNINFKFKEIKEMNIFKEVPWVQAHELLGSDSDSSDESGD